MKTSALIDRIIKAVPTSTRPGVLDTINDTIKIIVDRPLAMMRYKDPITGVDPILETVAGTKQYTLTNGLTGWDHPDVAFVGGISSDPEDYSEQIAYSSSYNIGNGDAMVTFKEDPGTSSYNILAYNKIPTLLSEQFNSGVIPFPDGLISYVYELSVALFERQVHGQSARYDQFISNRLPEIRGQMNFTSSSVTYKTYRNY